VETHRHHAVGEVERLLDAVAVVDVYVDVHNARVVLQELENRQHEVVDVTETGGFAFLRVMQPAGPVHGDVAEAVVQAHGAVDGTAGVQLAEVEQTVEYRAVLAEVVLLHLRRVLVLGIRGDLRQEIHVILRVERRHLDGVRTTRTLRVFLKAGSGTRSVSCGSCGRNAHVRVRAA
jgi:hypothetical protein